MSIENRTTRAASPYFSLLLPTRNSLPFVQEQVASIRRQGEQDYEIVAIDGCSTDGTWEYLQRCASEDYRFVIAQAAADGIYAALNRCVETARGKWILFAMSDDTLLDGCLSVLRREAEANLDVDVISYRIKCIDEAGADARYRWEERVATRYWGDLLYNRHRRDGSEEYWRHVLYGSVHISLTEFAARRAAVLSISPFDTKVGNWADILWTARLVRGRRLLHLPDLLATWRIRLGQTTQVSDRRAGPRNHLALIDKVLSDCETAEERARCIEYRDFNARIYKYLGCCGSSSAIASRLQDPHLLMRECLEIVMTGRAGIGRYRMRELRRLIPPLGVSL